MNYIINPSWFYWVNVVEGIRVIAVFFVAVSFITGAICIASAYTVYDEDDDEYKKLTRTGRICIAALIVSILVIIFVPTKDALIEMQVARFVTYENAEWTIENIKSAADYIIDAVKSLK